MTHTYHDVLPGFDERQIWKDGCPECERRGKDPVASLCTLDEDNFARAWRRAADWNRMSGPDIGRPSDAERSLLEMIWVFQVMFERVCGLPIGELPAVLPKIFERS
jgi:hypothetical protein